MLPALLPPIGCNQMVAGKYGFILFNQNDTVVGQSVLHYGEYFKNEIDVFESFIRPGWHVMDAGANIGTHTQAFARIVGPGGWVHAFEPQRLVFQALCANMALNSITNVDCENMALGVSNGRILVEELDPNEPKNFGELALGQSQAKRKVRMTTVDNYLEGRPLHFLKADIQGMEADCLRGAVKTIEKHSPILYLENDDPVKSVALLTYLGKLKYDVYWHLPLFFNPNNFAKEAKNIHGVGYIDEGAEYLETVGFSINVVCIPKVLNLPIQGLLKVETVQEHPMRRGKSRFRPN